MKNELRYFLFTLSIFSLIIPFSNYIFINNVSASTSGNHSINLENFSFTSVEGNEIRISDFTGKPIVIEWGASWCDICKNNQRSINDIYSSFQENAQFISLSYGGSGDSISNYAKIKNDRGYPWLYGVDTENHAKDVGVSTGTIWVLDSNLILQKQWLYQLVSANAIATTLNNILPPENVVTESFRTNVQPTILDDPLVLIFLIGVVLAIGVIGFGKLKTQKVYNPSSVVKKSDLKVDQKLEEIKHLVRSNPTSNLPQKSKRPRKR